MGGCSRPAPTGEPLPNYPTVIPSQLPVPFEYQPPAIDFSLRRFANFAFSTLARTVGQTDTVIYIQAGDVARMPLIDPAEGEFFNLTLFDDRLAPEIVYVYDVQPSGALTVTRGMEGTGAREWLPETKVANTFTGLAVQEIYGNVTQFDDVAQWAFAYADQNERKICSLERETAYLRGWLEELFGDRLGGPFGNASDGLGGDSGNAGASGVDGADLIRGSVTLDKLAPVVAAALHKPGDILVSGSPERPSEFHVRPEGQLFEVNKYPELFDRYGTTYNLPSDPAGTFRLPDYRHCTLVGVSDTVGQHVVRGGEPLFGEFPKALGDYWGFERHIITVPELPNYTPQGFVQAGAGAANIDLVTPGLGFGGGFFVELGGSAGIVLGGIAAGSPVINIPILNPLVERVSIQAIFNGSIMRINVPSQGQDEPHNNIQPSAAVNYWVFLGRPEDLG